MDTTPTSTPEPTPVLDEQTLMADWFDSVSYVEDYAGVVPETDDPEDENE